MSVLGDGFEQRVLTPIAVDTLCASDLLPFDLYVQGAKKGKPVLYRKRSYPLVQNDLEELAARGVHVLFISSGDCTAYRDHLREKVLNNQEVAPAKRYEVLREATRAVLSESLSCGDSNTAMEVTGKVGRDMVRTVCDSQMILADLLRVMSFDYSTFTHAMNVATYSLLIAKRLRIGDESVLIEIGQGALLHDLGKQYIPREILSKPGRLTEREQQIVRQHPTRGFLELCRRESMTWGPLMMVYQHHERCDGRGYPVGLTRPEIHEYARIAAIADVCDALMCDRTYRPSVLRSDVVEYLDCQAGRAFDEEMARCWIAAITSEM